MPSRSWKVKDLGVSCSIVIIRAGPTLPAGDPPFHCRPASLSYHYNGVQSFRTLCGCRPIAAACCKGVRIRAGPVQVRQEGALIILTMAVEHQEGTSMVVIVATVRLGPS